MLSERERRLGGRGGCIWWAGAAASLQRAADDDDVQDDGVDEVVWGWCGWIWKLLGRKRSR